MASATTLYNLLKSKGGRLLPAEVHLEIIERVLEQDAKSVKHLMSLSRDFCHLIKTFECSIIRRIRPNQIVGYQVLPSCVQPEVRTIQSMSYHWLSELDIRDMTVDFLIRHPLSYIEFDFSLSPESIPRISDSELGRHVATFKKKALTLLYQLADCTVGLKCKVTLRERQLGFLQDLDKLELATIGFFIQNLGLRYSRIAAAGLRPADEGLLREITCVFEEKVLRYGPFFAFATVNGSPEASAWSNFGIQQGLNDLRDFEEGGNVACSSLQSVLWLMFSEKANCSLRDGWDVAEQMIELDLISQRV